MTVARVAAQAKINLLLRVLAREASGYHSIETIFLRLLLADDVVVRIGDAVRGRSIDCVGDVMPTRGLGAAEENLAYRAALAYERATGWPGSFAIEIDKHIPVGGGLGGGSADAGAVLRALDALSPSPIGRGITELAASLGADVPFMTLESPMALGWGRGERLLPLPVLTPRPLLLVTPAFGVATREAYEWLSGERSEYAPRGSVLEPSEVDTWEGLVKAGVNDFERVVERRHPEIGSMRESLQAEGAVIAMMSGSGSSVFGVFDAAERAAAAREVVAQTYPGARTVLTRTAERVERVTV